MFPGCIIYPSDPKSYFLLFNFMSTCCNIMSPPLGPLLMIPHFQISMIKWCAMHVCHLGTDLWIVGNCLKTLLLDTDLWGTDNDDDERLLNAWLEFKQWARLNKWQSSRCINKTVFNPQYTIRFSYGSLMVCARHSMGKFQTKTITSRQHGYPELQSKAWNVTGCNISAKERYWKKNINLNSTMLAPAKARVCVAWMAAFLDNLCRDECYANLVLMKDCVFLGFYLGHRVIYLY